MKNIFFLFLLSLISFSFHRAQAQDCSSIILDDDFSNPSAWQSQGNGEVNVSNGSCNFDSVANGAYNRVYQDLGTILSDEYWKAECKFSILSQNPTGAGTGQVLMALTAGDLDFISFDDSPNNTPTSQDGIAIIFFSDDPTDNDINNWYFLLQGKKGTVRSFDFASIIFANDSISDYYVRLERAEKGLARLSVFADSAFSIHLPASPVTFAIDSTITDLTTIQHGTSTPGNPIRLIHAAIDNDFICESASIDRCVNLILEDDFSMPSAWQAQGNGDVNVSNGNCNFDNVANGNYNRVYQDLGTTLSDNYWKAECDFSILNQNPTGAGTGQVLMALTAGDLDFISFDDSPNNTPTSQDGVAIIFFSDDPTDNDINNWYFIIQGKKGTVRSFDFASIIFADASISDYFVRLERLEAGLAELSVFSDSAFSNHLSGSPVSFVIDSTITGLTTIQHGTSTPGNPIRLIQATIDNTAVCDDGKSATSISDWFEGNDEQILLYPNPTSDLIHIGNETSFPFGTTYAIYDIRGAKIMGNSMPLDNQINIRSLPKGVFLIRITGAEKNYWGKFQKAY